jgi:hypothetical protein
MALEGPSANDQMKARQERLKAAQAAAKEAMKPKPGKPSKEEQELAKMRAQELPEYVIEASGKTEHPASIKNLIRNTLEDVAPIVRDAREAVQQKTAEHMKEHEQLIDSLRSVNENLQSLRESEVKFSDRESLDTKLKTKIAIERLENVQRIAIERLDSMLDDKAFRERYYAEADADNEAFDKDKKVERIEAEHKRIFGEMESNLLKITRHLQNVDMYDVDAGPFEDFNPEERAQKYMEWFTSSLVQLKTVDHQARELQPNEKALQFSQDIERFQEIIGKSSRYFSEIRTANPDAIAYRDRVTRFYAGLYDALKKWKA